MSSTPPRPSPHPPSYLELVHLHERIALLIVGISIVWGYGQGSVTCSKGKWLVTWPIPV